MAISYHSHGELIQKGSALRWTQKVLLAVEEGELGSPGSVKKGLRKMVRKELGLENERELGTWRCVTKRTVSGNKRSFHLPGMQFTR